jgi:hypothetical protein
MILMASSHIYMFCFSKHVHVLHIYIYIYIYIYILLALCQNPLNINFWALFDVSRTATTVFTRHVRRSRVSAIYKGAEYPFKP